MSEQDIAAERIRLLRENAKHVGVPIATEHDIYWVCDKLTAAQSRVEGLEATLAGVKQQQEDSEHYWSQQNLRDRDCNARLCEQGGELERENKQLRELLRDAADLKQRIKAAIGGQ